jgi:hypothetical protein
MVLAVACADANPNNNNNNLNVNHNLQNNTNNTNADAGLPAPVIFAISPSQGPVAGGTTVEITGQYLVDGLTVTIGGNPATGVQWLGADRVAAVTPAGAAPGPVDVRVDHPDGQHAEVLGAFTYTSSPTTDVSWCLLGRPATLDTRVQVATAPVYGRVYAETVTDHLGKGLGISADLGYGPVGSDPATSAAWIWTTAVYSGDAQDEELAYAYDEYVASLTVPTAGSYDYAFRFSGGAAFLYCDLDSSDNGYTADQAGALTVAENPDPLPDVCRLVGPIYAEALVSEPTAVFTGQVGEAGVTDGAGAGAGLVGELGYGPQGTQPGTGNWVFTAAAYSADAGSEDAYTATLTVVQPGLYHVAFRFSLDGGPWVYCDADGSENGYSAASAATLSVTSSMTGVDWCKLQWPATAVCTEDTPTGTIYGRVFVAGITPGPGQGADVVGEVGFGPTGSDPGTDPSWAWTPAAYFADRDGLAVGDLSNDEYTATLTPPDAGTFDYAYRFSVDGGPWLYCDTDDSDNGYAPARSGVLTVWSAQAGLSVTAAAPARGSVLGGTVVRLTGTGFVAGSTVSFGAVPSAGVTYVNATTLDVTVPSGVPGVVDVTVTNPGPTTATLPAAFEYGLIDTPTVDGDLADWDAALRAAENTVATDWGVGQNELAALYVAFDETSLYVGIDGYVSGTDNAILALLDLDYGTGTGVRNLAQITDGSGSLDAVISGLLQVTDVEFGAEYAFGSKAMAEVVGNVADGAGWRRLSPADNLPWISGTVNAGTQVLECSIPLATLWPGGIPQAGAEVGLVVKISNYEGTAYANQTLPEENANATVSQILVFRIFPAGSF